MTNTQAPQDYIGRHRTDEPFGVIIRHEPTPHAGAARTHGLDNVLEWRMLARVARAQAAVTRTERARPQLPSASPMHWNTCWICGTEWSSLTPSSDCGSQDEKHKTARGQ